MIYPNLDVGRKNYREMRALLERVGRPEVAIAPAIYPIVAETRSEAEDKKAAIEKLTKPIDALTLLSEVLNFDFASKQPDEPFTDEDLASISGLRAICDRVIGLSASRTPRSMISSNSAAVAPFTNSQCSSARPGMSPISWSSGSTRPVTASSCRRRTCPEAMTISSGW